MDYLNILVCYGGEKAKEPRDELINFIRNGEVSEILGQKICVYKVSDKVPNTKLNVQGRVKEAISKSNKVIVLLTPDTRSEHGSTNANWEHGYAQGNIGEENVLVINSTDVKIPSNRQGEVYVELEECINLKIKNDIIRFLMHKNITYQNKILASTNKYIQILRNLTIQPNLEYSEFRRAYLGEIEKIEDYMKQLYDSKIILFGELESNPCRDFDVKYGSFIKAINNIKPTLFSIRNRQAHLDSFVYDVKNKYLPYYEELRRYVSALQKAEDKELNQSNKESEYDEPKNPINLEKTNNIDFYDLAKALSECEFMQSKEGRKSLISSLDNISLDCTDEPIFDALNIISEFKEFSKPNWGYLHKAAKVLNGKGQKKGFSKFEKIIKIIEPSISNMNDE